MLENNKRLEELNLGQNNFVDEDLEALKDYLGRTAIIGEALENHHKKLKDKEAIIEKNKKLKTAKKPEEPVPFVEELTLIGETYYIVKNCTLKGLNLMQNQLTENCFTPLTYILDGNPDIFITMDGKYFSKTQKDKLTDQNGKYAAAEYPHE